VLFIAAYAKERFFTLFTLIYKDVGINVIGWWQNCNFGQCSDNFQ